VDAKAYEELVVEVLRNHPNATRAGVARELWDV
jgi:hypothetical protein